MFTIGQHVITTVTVWHGYDRPAGTTGTVVPAPANHQPDPLDGPSYWVSTDAGLINVWPHEIVAL